MSQRLRRRERLSLARDYARVHARQCRVRGRWLAIAACENGLTYSRLGLAVGRRWGPAHDRVRLKRLYREAFRLEKTSMPTGYDLILMPVQATGTELAALRQELPALAARLARLLHSRTMKVDDTPAQSTSRANPAPPRG